MNFEKKREKNTKTQKRKDEKRKRELIISL